MSRSAGRKGGNVATATKPAGTNARMLPGFTLGKPPPPGDPGWGKLLGVRPGAGFAATSIAAVVRTETTISGKPGGVVLLSEQKMLLFFLVTVKQQAGNGSVSGVRKEKLN